ncbi:MAG: alpha/beta fold hydrolase, partial [Actinobacteria bacterium]|nr:alpha/beta fold hydrolase [Actinomycetota bacterium]
MTTRHSWDRTGAGEPLLLLHGIGTTREDFSALRPALEAEYDVLAVDLPGHGDSPALSERPTIRALTDAIEADLDALGMGRVHVLGNSLGARIALELARRDRALSVVAIAPSGLNMIPERIYQGAAMSTFRLLMCILHPAIGPLARFPAGRAALLTGLRSQPWLASEVEACALRKGFGECEDFWRLLWWGMLADVPIGLGDVRCPVILAQGTADIVATGQTPRYLLALPGATFQPLLGAGHAPQSDAPDSILRLVR